MRYQIALALMILGHAISTNELQDRLQDNVTTVSRPQSTLLMCTSELEHLTHGGTGVVVADSSRTLAATGWRVMIVLDSENKSPHIFKAWLAHAKHEWSIAHDDTALALIRLSDLAVDTVPPNAPMPLIIWHKSRQWARALQRIKHPYDAVEFCDYGAPAYHTLLWRLKYPGDSWDARLMIWIRTHGLHQAIIDRHHSHGLDSVYRMEVRALQLADAVIANSPGIGWAYRRDHELDPSRLYVIPPTLGTLKSGLLESIDDRPPINFSRNRNILIYGKLQRVKGPELAARAIVQVMRALADDWHGDVIFAGDDVPCDVNPRINMSACILLSDVPQKLRPRVHFTERLTRGSLGSFAARERIRFVILPSRYETFCLAAHEAYHFGIPVVLPRLPAYEGYFADRNSLMFAAGSVEDLARVVTLLLLHDDLVDRIVASSTPIIYPDPAQGYRRLIDG